MVFIIFTAYLKTHYYKEAFNSNEKKYILLGDSILKNNSYVGKNKSVEDLLFERNINVNCFAEDHSKIVDIYSQIDRISIDDNNSNTHIFLSGGGNDILSYYIDQKNTSSDLSILYDMFTSYKNIIKTIRVKLPNAKLFLLDIYYPYDLQYKPYHSIIKEWNNMIYDYAKKSNNDINGIIYISDYLTQKDDFLFGIEPSVIGGNKIVELLINAN